MRRTKIVATIGPASWDEPVLRELVRAGLDVARLNFSHGDHKTHARTLKRLRRIAAEEGRFVGVIQDLGGPKIRTGTVKGGGTICLNEGDTLRLVGGLDTAEPGCVGVSYGRLCEEIGAGERIFIDDGRIELRVDSKQRGELICSVVRGGEMASRKGVNVPGVAFAGLPAVTEKDWDDLEWGIENDVDYVALSFVRHPDDVLALKKRLADAGAKIPVIAKIEKPQALERIESIVAASDGIMIARGDLGVELEPERVPIVQKDLIDLCNAEECPVITATQMLESMTASPRPTRAEVSDVANAIFDGTDAVMLSGETASGKYPLAALKMMVRIAETADGNLRKKSERRAPRARPDTLHEAVGHAAEMVTRELGIRIIVVATVDGLSALGTSKSRPDAVILAVAPQESLCRRMNLYWGVTPLKASLAESQGEMIQRMEKLILDRGFARPGDLMVLLSASPVDAPGPARNIHLCQLSEGLGLGVRDWGLGSRI